MKALQIDRLVLLQAGEPIHVVHVPIHQFTDSINQVAVNHGFGISSAAYAIGMQLSAAEAMANMYNAPPASAPPPHMQDQRMVGAYAHLPNDTSAGPFEAAHTFTQSVRRVGMYVLLAATACMLLSRSNAAKGKKAKRSSKPSKKRNSPMPGFNLQE